MNITVLHLIEGARRARGLTVVIDVFRAFSTACHVMANGAELIIPVAGLDEAYRLKRDHPDFVLMGERHGLIQPGFDFGNSPTHVQTADFSGKTIVLTTSAGTQGLTNALGADEVLTGSFVNAAAIAGYIRKRGAPTVSMVCMGYEAKEPADEDDFCAEYIVNLLEGRPTDLAGMAARLRTGSGRRFLDGASRDSMPETDFDLCLDFDRFDFVLKARRDSDFGLVLLKSS
jgi:2-phosphosulfolactate phosphatase